MPSDYEKILKMNIEDYGKETRHLEILGSLYADRTHFIFELLQNAEDAVASQILFTLFDDRLEVSHNGRFFNEPDVRGVCGVGEGTKTDDLTKIGKFGIGFKSVYAYTATPEIHSGEENFKIEHYIRPYAVSARATADTQLTLFVFPFDKKGMTPETACEEIGKALRNLSARTLLFLRNINKIEYKLPDSANGSFSREETERGSARQVSLSGNNDGEDEEENWLVFQRPVAVPCESKTVLAEVSYRLEVEETPEGTVEHIVRVNESPLVVYFPTEKDTKLGFLIQGPYRTTPSRDNIPKDKEWNKTLIKETAQLAADTLSEIKDLGMLTVSFLKALPVRTEDFPENSMFYPIFASVRETLASGELLPADDGSFVSAENAKLARSSGLKKLLSKEQLCQLFQTSAETKWLCEGITDNRTYDLRHYLLNCLNVNEIDSEGFARKINIDFLSGQSDDWFKDFYVFLTEQNSLWKEPLCIYDEKWGSGILRSKPLIRLENGSLTTPFREDEITPKVYLPPEYETELPVVKRAIASDEKACNFLKQLKLSEPNVVDEVVELILPKYAQNRLPDITVAENQSDIQKIILAIQSAPCNKEKKVVEAIKQTPFLKSTNYAGDALFKKPQDVYLDKQELRIYFSTVNDAWFLCDDYSLSESDMEILCDKDKLGVSLLPRRILTDECSPSCKEYSTKEESIENYHLHGLTHFMQTIQACENFDTQKNRSSVLWNLLKESLELNSKFFKAKYNWFYYSEKSKYFDSAILDQLRDSKWIPTKDGSLEKPGDIETNQLIEEFSDATELIKSLEIVDSSIERALADWYETSENDKKEEFAKKIGFKSKEEAEEIAKLCNENPEMLQELKERVEKNKNKPKFPSRPIANPERRQERIKDDLSESQTKTSEKKTRTIRTTYGSIDAITYLRNTYTNDDEQMVCQICKEEMPFKNKDGQHHFEKREILTRKYLSKEHEAQYLALCPLCAAKYKVFVKNKSENDAMNALKQAVLDAEIGSGTCKVPLTLGDEETCISFVDPHLQIIQKAIKDSAESELVGGENESLG